MAAASPVWACGSPLLASPSATTSSCGPRPLSAQFVAGPCSGPTVNGFTRAAAAVNVAGSAGVAVSAALAACYLRGLPWRSRRMRRRRCARRRVKEEASAEQFRETLEQRELWNELFNLPDPAGEALEKDLDASGVLQKKKVMIMISDTGGGHRASANALAEALEETLPGQVETTIRDIWTDDCPWPYNAFVPAYMWMAKKTLVWRLFYFWGKFPPTRWILQRTANVACLRAFRYAILRDDPDLIISVHPLCQHITIRCLKRLARRSRRKIPFVTVVTDLDSAHPLWFHPKANNLFVPTERVASLALNCGVPASSINVHGLPLRRSFWQPESRSRQEVRQALGLTPTARTALVVGGGDGVGRLSQVAMALGQRLGEVGNAQLIVICGKNEKVQRQLREAHWPAGLQVHVKGFVSNMDEWMAAADAIVTKAGPGTIAESCTRALPVMLSSFLPGQERGNVEFVIEGGFGEYSPNPAIIAKTVGDWLEDPSRLDQLSRRATANSRPSATLEIAKKISRRWLATDPETLDAVVVAELQRCKGQTDTQLTRAEVLLRARKELTSATQALSAAQNRLREAEGSVREALADVSSSRPGRDE